MRLHEEVIKLLQQAKADGTYHNPHIVRGLLDVLEDVLGFEDEELSKWEQDLWGM